jgi:amidase
LHNLLGPDDLLCIPTTLGLAPRKDALTRRSSLRTGYYPRTLGLTSVAGIGQLPQVSLPVAHVAGVPLGLSLLGRHGQDALLPSKTCLPWTSINVRSAQLSACIDTIFRGLNFLLHN